MLILSAVHYTLHYILYFIHSSMRKIQCRNQVSKRFLKVKYKIHFWYQELGENECIPVLIWHLYNDKAQEQPVSSLSPWDSWIGNCCFENGNYHSSQPLHWLWHWPCQGPGPTVSALSSPHYLQPLTLRGNYLDKHMYKLRLSVFLSLRDRDIHCSVLPCSVWHDNILPWPLSTLLAALCRSQLVVTGLAGTHWTPPSPECLPLTIFRTGAGVNQSGPGRPLSSNQSTESRPGSQSENVTAWQHDEHSRFVREKLSLLLKFSKNISFLHKYTVHILILCLSELQSYRFCQAQV